HRSKIIRLQDGFARFGRLQSFGPTQRSEPPRKVVQVLAFEGIDDAQSFERDVEVLGKFFDLVPVAEQDGCSESQRIELTCCLQHTRLSAFWKNNSFRMALQLFNDVPDETHARKLAG